VDDIKNLILDKAKERAERFGFKKTTMDEISKDCRISKKTIYEHFVDKEDMFRSLVLRESQRTIQILFSQIADVSDPLEKITLLIQNSISYFNQDHFITKVLKDDDMAMALVDNDYQDIIDAEVISLIAALIRDGKQQGKLRDVDEEITAYIGHKLFQAFTYARTGPLRHKQNEQYYTEVLIDFIVNAIIKK
jgi:AcrR family transcriptional regulator